MEYKPYLFGGLKFSGSGALPVDPENYKGQLWYYAPDVYLGRYVYNKETLAYVDYPASPVLSGDNIRHKTLIFIDSSLAIQPLITASYDINGFRFQVKNGDAIEVLVGGAGNGRIRTMALGSTLDGWYELDVTAGVDGYSAKVNGVLKFESFESLIPIITDTGWIRVGRWDNALVTEAYKIATVSTWLDGVLCFNVDYNKSKDDTANGLVGSFVGSTTPLLLTWVQQ